MYKAIRTVSFKKEDGEIVSVRESSVDKHYRNADGKLSAAAISILNLGVNDSENGLIVQIEVVKYD
jgi:hypothetical protein